MYSNWVTLRSGWSFPSRVLRLALVSYNPDREAFAVCDGARTNRMFLKAQFLGQAPRALTRPAKRRFRDHHAWPVPPEHPGPPTDPDRDGPKSCVQPPGLRIREVDSPRCQPGVRLQFLNASRDSVTRQPCCLRNPASRPPPHANSHASLAAQWRACSSIKGAKAINLRRILSTTAASMQLIR